MKKATILGISSNNKFIIKDQNQALAQLKLQGFIISDEVTLRPLFDEIINQQIQCSFNKALNSVRYQNESFLIKLIEEGALILNQKQLDNSKLFSQQQKLCFSKTVKKNESQKSQLIGINLNKKQNKSIIDKIIKEKNTIKAKIQFLSDKIMLRLDLEERKNAFLSCKLQLFKHFFQLFPQLTFWKNKILPLQLDLKIISQKFNILTQQIQVFVNVNEQFTLKMIKQGWITTNQKNYYINSRQNFKKLANVQIQTMKEYKGIYSNKSQILSFIYAKSNFVGIITNIIEAYIYEITSLKTNQTSKVQLPMVSCPIGEDVGSFQCRQFARKQLIGREVNVYLHKEEGLNTTGNIIRIQDWKDVEYLLLQNGYATVREEYKKSFLGQKYISLQNKAKQKRKALHRKDVGNKRCQDLTQVTLGKSRLNSQSHRRLQVLNLLSQNQSAVIQQILNPLTYKVKIQSLQVLIIVKLEGILLPFLNPNLKQYSQIKSQSQKYLKINFYQRNVIASITDYDPQTFQFIGTLKLEKEKKQFQQILIKQSFVYADKFNFISRYSILQSQAKKFQKLIWQKQLECFQPGHQLDQQKYCFEGRFSWIKDGKIAYVQPKDKYKTIENLQQKIRQQKLKKLNQKKLKLGAWVVAPYEGQMYRAIIKIKKEPNVTVEFLDWGNEQSVKIDELRELSEQYLYLEKQCIKVNLNLVCKTRKKDALEKLRETLFEGGTYVFKKVNGDYVDFFDSQIQSVNQQLILKGVLKADTNEIKKSQNKEILKIVQQQLRKQRIGIWEQSDESQVQQSQNY